MNNVKIEQLPNLLARMSTQLPASLKVQLSPAVLGPIEVEIRDLRGELSISIVAREVLTKEAIEQNISRLRQGMGEAGLNLNDVQVTHERKSSQQREFDGGGFMHADTNKNKDESTRQAHPETDSSDELDSKSGEDDFERLGLHVLV